MSEPASEPGARAAGPEPAEATPPDDADLVERVLRPPPLGGREPLLPAPPAADPEAPE